MKRRIAAFIASFIASGALACTAPPPHWKDSPYTMVIDTPTIVLAKAVRVDREDVWSTVRFEVIETLRGEPPEQFSLRGWSEIGQLGDFTGHRDPHFWVDNGGGSVAPGDCKAYGVFEAGQEYLIFLDGPNYPRSFENVRSKEDLWYQTVVAALATLKMVLEAQ